MSKSRPRHCALSRSPTDHGRPKSSKRAHPIPSPLRSSSYPTKSPRAKPSIRFGSFPISKSQLEPIVRHGDPRWWRRIGVEGRRLGRGPQRSLGLGQHPAAPLLRLPLLLLRSRGCFGCCDKTVKKIGELSKALITHDQLTVGEPFWSTTTIDVSQADLKGFPPLEIAPGNLDEHESGSSHRLVITESGRILLPQSGSSHKLTLPESGSSHGLPESVIPGRILWEQIREEWTEIKRLRPKVKQVREPVLSWSAAYQTCLVTNKSFPRPVPLYEVVDFFADMWEESGMYDM